MGCQCNVLRFLQGFGLEEYEAALANRADFREVRVWRSLESHVKHHRVLRQAVEMGDRGDKNRGSRRNRDIFARSNWVEDCEERVCIVPCSNYLYCGLAMI